MKSVPETAIISNPSIIPDATKPRSQRRDEGKILRDVNPRSTHAVWKPPADRADVVAILEESNQDRLSDLIPLRFARMLQSPLAFLRGSASIMAADLAGLPTTNIRVQSCGDCHLQNFGWFATPERNLIFDITDFDESRRAPWEWDVKRLVTSVVLASRELQVPASPSSQEELGRATARSYREHLAEFETMSPLEMWYVRLDAAELMKRSPEIGSASRCQQILDAASKRTMDQLLPKITQRVDGKLQFKDRPPLISHPSEFDRLQKEIHDLIQQYRGTLSDERRVLLDRYQMVDVAYKVVGVGSVGLRCGIILMLDPDEAALVLQIKEARASVLEKFVGKSKQTHDGHRIVHGQRLMQAASDQFLGWANDSAGRCYYFRQLRDMKLSIGIDQMTITDLKDYAQLCGWALARAHAKAGDASTISGYLGSGESFDEALGQFGIAYADQSETDFKTLQTAAESGRIPVAKDPEQKKGSLD